MNRSEGGRNAEVLLHNLEQEAWRNGWQPLRLTSCRQCLGLVLRRPGVSAAELLAALPSALERESRPIDPAPPWHLSGSAGSPESAVATVTDQHRFLGLLAAELNRVQETRLPCSLLLLEADGLAGARAWTAAEQYTAIARQLAREINGCLRETDILVHYDVATLAIILPGTNLRKACQCAQRIWQKAERQQLRLPETTRPLTTSIGISICFADDLLTAEEFFDLAAKELEEARRLGGNRISQPSGQARSNGCQVSVEERAQLFSFFRKEADT